jgi:dUTP pyrophosphatase
MLYHDEYNVSYYLYPRSSISSTSMILKNSVGIIDAGYRGNLKAKVSSEQVAEKGSRYFQICAPDLKPIRVKVVDELTSTTRNTGGFGSTN